MAKAKVETRPVETKAMRSAMGALTAAVNSVIAAIATITGAGHPQAEKIDAILTKVNARVATVQKRIDPDAAAKREAEKKRKQVSKLEAKIAELKASLAA
jgi:hypothetical protein